MRRSRRAGRLSAAPEPGRVRDPGAVGLRRPDRAREPRLLRAHPARSRRARIEETIDEVDLRPQARPARQPALRRPAGPRLAGDRAPQPPGAARPRRADGRPRPGAPARPLAALPLPGRGRLDAARLQPRDGRGRPLPRAAPAPRRRPARRRTTPDELRRRTGEQDLEAAFLALAEGGGGSELRASPAPRAASASMRQLGHDPRTVALVLVVPVVLVVLIKYVFRGSPVFDRIGGPLLGVFPLISMFLVTSITMLRERTTGTLERLMTMPLAKLDLLAGYAAAFALVAARPGRARLDRRLLGARPARRRREVGGDPARGRRTPCSARRSACSSAPSRAPSSRRCSSCPRSSSRSSSICGLLAPAQPHERASSRSSPGALPLTYAYDALDRTTRGVYGARLAVDVAVVLGLTAVALARRRAHAAPPDAVATVVRESTRSGSRRARGCCRRRGHGKLIP